MKKLLIIFALGLGAQMAAFGQAAFCAAAFGTDGVAAASEGGAVYCALDIDYNEPDSATLLEVYIGDAGFWSPVGGYDGTDPDSGLYYECDTYEGGAAEYVGYVAYCVAD